MGHILVTGGCGYIGSHVVKALSLAGEKVVVYDNLSAGNPTNLLYNEELVIGDIRDRDSLSSVFLKHDFEAVLHFAALVNAAESVELAELYEAVNSIGSKNVWELSNEHGIPYALYASSAAVYGTPNSSHPISESHPLKPTSPYGATKLAGEESLVKNHKHYLAFRFFNVGGAEIEGRLGQSRASNAIMPRLFAAAHNQTAITISGNDYDTKDGTVIRDFVHVEDIASMFVGGLFHLRSGGKSGIYNLGSGSATSMKELHDLVQQITNSPIPIKYAPRNVGDISYSLADISKAQDELNYTPRHTLADIVRSGYHAYEKLNH